MAFSAVQICNMALGHIGVGQRISALSDDSEEARACDTYFEPDRNLVLEAFPWNFAGKRSVLALVEEDPNADWGYAYRWPTGCLKPLHIISGLRPDPAPPPYEIGHDDNGRLIFSDENPATLLYTAELTNPQWWPAAFAVALSWRLAADIAFQLEASASLRDRAMQGYQQALVEAEANSLNGEQPDTLPDSGAIRARE